MPHLSGHLAARAAAVWAVATALLAGGGRLLLPDVVRGPAAVPAGFERVLTVGCEVALLVSLVWLWVAASAVLADAVRGRTVRRRGVPEPFRRLVLACCGLAVAGAVAAPAHATPGSGGARPGEPDRSVLSGLPLPDRAGTAAHVARLLELHAHPRPGPSPRRAPRVRVVVTPGDTLWALAEQRLPATAAADEVAAAWREVYRDNRSVIGADPHLIRPGQRLWLPGR